MKMKKSFVLAGLIIGVMSLFALNKVQASEITSVFDNLKLNRLSVQQLSVSNSLQTKVLGIKSERESGNKYNWNVTTTDTGKTAWKIGSYSSTQSNTSNYDELIYCLNASRGFENANGEMAEGAKDEYATSINMQDLTNKSTIGGYAGGTLSQNYNKVLWILDNSYIQIKQSNYQSTTQYKELMRKANIAIESNDKCNLTEDDIEVVQQMAIWYFTNSDNNSYHNENLPSLYINGQQLSSIYFGTDSYGSQITGAKRQNKAGILYKYFINNASATYTRQLPSLDITNSNVNIEESGEYYIVGPYSLTVTNVNSIKEITATVIPSNYKLLNSSKSEITGNDFTDVFNSNFYLKIEKSQITGNMEIKVKLQYKYDVKDLTFMTDSTDAENTQPVVIIDSYEQTEELEIKVPIELVNVKVDKTWVDNDNQDGIRPTSIKVQLYENGKLKGSSVTLNSANNWSYTWTKLLTGRTYTVKELNSNNVAVNNNENLNNNYTATYSIQNNVTTITNTHIPEKISKTVNKIWDDSNNQDATRPESVTVILYKTVNNVKQKLNKDVILNNSNNWRYTWNDLDKYEDGEEIIYTAEEVVPNNYQESHSNNTFTITNRYIPGIVSKTVVKEWEDEDDFDNSRPNNVTVQLYANGEAKGEAVVLNATNGWTYTWNSLPEKENGQIIEYTISETKIGNTLVNQNQALGYTVRYTVDGNRIIVTNSHTAGKPDLALRKLIVALADKNGVTKTIDNYREVTIDKSNLIDNNNSTTTAEYKHRKDPVEVEIGDIVTYNLNIYNEGNIDARASKIIDQLPDGLKYDSIITQGYTVSYNEDTNRITITKNGTDNLEAFDGQTIDSETIQIKCKVTAQVSSSTRILTNIAWISEMKNSDNEIFANDIDSSTNNSPNVNKENMSDYIGKESNKTDLTDNNYYYQGQQDDDDFEKLIIKSREFDLALRKFITKVNQETYSREPEVDTSTIATAETATYKHIKQPIAVQKGDIVTYTIRIYNEGQIDGYANMITDHLPDNLLPIIDGVNGIDAQKYKDEIEFNENWLWVYTDNENTVTTSITSKTNSEIYSELTGLENITDTKLNAYIEGTDELDYIDVQIKCLVSENAVRNEYITNIAEIIDAEDINGEKGDGNDSELSNVDYSNLSDYKNTQAISSIEESYIPGQEDDDDFEKLQVKEFDLALRKFITKVNNKTYSREPIVDTSRLGTIGENGKGITTAKYNHSKEPVIVETGDIVTYCIRIYNEGSLDGYANEITDDMPDGLEFMPNSSINVSYKWKMLDSDGNETTDLSKAVMITTDCLSDENTANIIRAVSETDRVKSLQYKDVQVQFKVVSAPQKLQDNIIKNVAQISEDSDRDIDSAPNRTEKYNYDLENNEDDIDYEPIKLQYFDLALRKFITKVNTTDYNNRYPEVVYNENGEITYKHTKDPVLVSTSDTITYTLRIYNEGQKSGYAEEVIDNLPDGLEFMSESETNKFYKWVLVDEAGNVTEDISKAVKVKTEYLKDEIIDGFVVDGTEKILSYKDLKIEFKVIEPNTSDRILINTAEISKDSDDDIDSTPENDNLNEDDIDREYVKVQYFDLALKKWVTASKVTVDGKTTTTKTGFTEDSEGIAKVDLVSKKLSKTTVKFVYSIKVINEGELPGYAYEVKDYIPKGLKFVAEDNKNWKELEDGTVVTEQLKDTLLNPGESVIVEIVLTWKNSTTNLGVKTNYAEISKDSADDIDSTPDNYELKEDDIDDAKVILSIKTAGTPTYIGLILISITILTSGIFAIRKYVIK